MQSAIKSEIKRLAKRNLDRESRKLAKALSYEQKFERRTGLVAGTPAPRLSVIHHRHFDPIYCARNANFLAKVIWQKVLTEQYEPVPAVSYSIPKPDGSHRVVMAFSIPDAALANVLLRRTRERNRKRLSPSSFAYHPDKNVFDAVLNLKQFEHDGKLFSVQIDFQKYFDLIPSDYIKGKLNDRETLSLTPHEKHIFEKFLHHYYAPSTTYPAGAKRRRIGTPQGSSASLLLANIANHDLDMMLASEAGRFVRFADDVVALCSNYEQALRLERCFQKHCRISGLKVNHEKSPGIAVVSSKTQEISTVEGFDYLGYRFTDSGLTTTSKFERNLKRKVSRLLNIYLLDYLDFGHSVSRCSAAAGFDWDLLGFVYELRRVFYGGLTETEVQNFLGGQGKFRRVQGLMGFYCLIEDATTLRRLDGWIASMTRRAMQLRNRRLQHTYFNSCPTPNNQELISGSWLNQATWRTSAVGDENDGDDDELEVAFPSLVRGWRAARKHYYTFGLENVEAPRYVEYSDLSLVLEY